MTASLAAHLPPRYLVASSAFFSVQKASAPSLLADEFLLPEGIAEFWKRRQNARCSAGNRALSKSLKSGVWDVIAVVVEGRCW